MTDTVEVTQADREVVLRACYGAIFDRAAQVSTPTFLSFDHAVTAVANARTAAAEAKRELVALLGTAREHINDLSACTDSPEWKRAAHEFVGEVDTALGEGK